MNSRFTFILCLSAALGLSVPALAGPGHDHGDEAQASPSGQSLPRFVASSETFELVGVLNGKHLTVYLDRTDTNEPVKDARVDLEWAGTKLKLETHAPGEFEATLAQEPQPGVISVTATVMSGKDTDLLAADLDLHGNEQPSAARRTGWQRYGYVGAGLAVAMLAGLAWLQWRRRKMAMVARMGGAA